MCTTNDEEGEEGPPDHVKGKKFITPFEMTVEIGRIRAAEGDPVRISADSRNFPNVSSYKLRHHHHSLAAVGSVEYKRIER